MQTQQSAKNANVLGLMQLQYPRLDVQYILYEQITKSMITLAREPNIHEDCTNFLLESHQSSMPVHLVFPRY
jgi:hypothetical protein